MDIYAFVGLPVRFFRSIGLVPFYLHPSISTPPLMLVLLIISITMMGICMVGEAMHFVKMATQPEFFVRAATVFLFFGYNMLSYVKMFTVLYKRPVISDVMSELDAMFPRSMAARYQYRVEAHVRRAMRMIRPYSLFQMLMIGGFNMFPSVEAIVRVLRTGQWHIDFPYENWYPKILYSRGWFQLCYMCQFWISYTSAAGTLATDILMCSLAAQVCMHFDRLSERLREMRPTGGRRERDEYAELCDCIRTHVRIINISNNLDDTFDICILFNVMSSVVIICMQGFLVTISSNDPIALLKFATALFTCATQVLLISVFGDLFTESSEAISDAAWHCEWYNGSARFKRALLLMMQRAQRPQYLTAYKYTFVSMVMFTNVLRCPAMLRYKCRIDLIDVLPPKMQVMSTSWQFFVLISSVYDD